jgi:hypothetical protein
MRVARKVVLTHFRLVWWNGRASFCEQLMVFKTAKSPRNSV